MMKKGFTLFEILVASSIFAMVMVITTGVIAQMSSYNNKIKLSKNVSEETRKIADQITADVRQAISYETTVTTINVFSEAYCLPNVVNTPIECTQKNHSTPSDGFVTASSDPSNTLIITAKDYFIVYYSHSDNKAIYRLLLRKVDSEGDLNYPYGIVYNSDGLLSTFQVITGNNSNYENYRLTSDDTEASVNFAGFTSSNNSTTLQQPYVQFYIVSKSKDYDTTMVPSQRAKAELRSMVTSRSYAN